MSRIVDVTLPVRPGMLTYPGDPVVSIERTSDMRNGEVANLSVLSMSTHTGTHVDPPIHFVEDGVTIDRVSLETLVGEALVVDMRGVGTIGTQELDTLRRSRSTGRCSARASRSWRGWIFGTSRPAGTRCGVSRSRSTTATAGRRGSSWWPTDRRFTHAAMTDPRAGSRTPTTTCRTPTTRAPMA